MNELMLFTDVSVDTKINVGYGAYLSVSGYGFSLDSLKSQIKVKRYEKTNSTKLELQTLLWALNDIRPYKNEVIVYTDSQNIIGLLKRRERLEKNNYFSKENKLITNHQLYQEFYKVTDHLNCQFVKVSGHKRLNQKDYIDQLFTLVDRASRNALRKKRL